MKRSEINELIRSAAQAFAANGWVLPPEPKWDVTDFGLGRWQEYGLVLVNLAEEPEYCEKLMYARQNMRTPRHHHRRKKEDIIVRAGRLAVQLWGAESGPLKRNGTPTIAGEGEVVELRAGERVTLFPGVDHEFWPLSEECIIGEVSTANDDVGDNFFLRDDIGRFPEIEEDEAPLVSLLSDR